MSFWWLAFQTRIHTIPYGILYNCLTSKIECKALPLILNLILRQDQKYTFDTNLRLNTGGVLRFT